MSPPMRWLSLAGGKRIRLVGLKFAVLNWRARQNRKRRPSAAGSADFVALASRRLLRRICKSQLKIDRGATVCQRWIRATLTLRSNALTGPRAGGAPALRNLATHP